MDRIIRLRSRGSFYVGGQRTTLEHLPVEEYPYNNGKFIFRSDPNGTHWVKQMYVQYNTLEEPVSPYPVLMWHGGGLTGAAWETTPDGREGWDTLFLRAGYDVYVSDAVERGRASWAKFPEINPTPPIFHSYEARWLNLKMGPVYPIPYRGCRFPTACYDQLMMQSVPRWLTSDQWALEAYMKYLELMRDKALGVVILAHSQGSIFALEGGRRFPDFVKALILVEAIALPNANEDYSGVKDIPQLYIYGDFMSPDYDPVHDWVQSIRTRGPLWRSYLDSLGADYRWLNLPELGIKGNSHMLMMDNNSHEIAAIIWKWLEEKGLTVTAKSRDGAWAG